MNDQLIDYQSELRAEKVRGFVDRICRWLTSRPDYGIRCEHAGDEAVAVVVSPAGPDRGTMVSTSHHMRVLVRAAAGRLGFGRATYIVDVPPERPAERARESRGEDPAWPAAEVRAELRAALDSLLIKPYSLAEHHADRKSVYDVEIAAAEASHVTDAELGEALSRVFGAIARARGRKLFITLSRAGS